MTNKAPRLARFPLAKTVIRAFNDVVDRVFFRCLPNRVLSTVQVLVQFARVAPFALVKLRPSALRLNRLALNKVRHLTATNKIN